MSLFSYRVACELHRARRDFPKMASLHEGYAILLEEVEELWEEIKKNPRKRDLSKVLEEAIQVGAMVQRLAEDGLAPMLTGDEGRPHE